MELPEDGHRRQAGDTQQSGFQHPAQSGRNPFVKRKLILLRIARVAAEQLVAAVSSQHSSDAVGARQPRAIVGRDRRSVTERLVVRGGDQRNRGDDIVRRHIIFVVIGSKMARGDACIFHLVVSCGRKAYRIRSRRDAFDRSQQAGDGRAVGPTAQERAAIRAVGYRGDPGIERGAKRGLEFRDGAMRRLRSAAASTNASTFARLRSSA
jgi:hypothetical protein